MTSGGDAPRLVGVSLGDEPAAWAALGFTVVDGRIGFGALVVTCRGDGAPPSLRFDRPHPAGARSFAGVSWTVEPERRRDPGAAPHPNGVGDIDHVVITGPDADALRDDVTAAGMEIRRERAATLGDREMVQLFAFAGDVLLELVAGGAGPEPDGLWGLAVVAPDLDATVATLGERCGPANGAVQSGRRIATVRTAEAGCSVRLAAMSPRH